MKELTLKEAKRLSILKWELIVNNKGCLGSIEDHNELKDLFNQCGFCEKYLDNSANPYCGECPLVIEGIGWCDSDEHPFSQWSNEDEGFDQEKAQAVLDLIKSVKV